MNQKTMMKMKLNKIMSLCLINLLIIYDILNFIGNKHII